LARGLHFGFIASGDIHNAYPNEWGKGTMACYARELTRESLWDAFRQRSVYAVTGDRIRVDFEVAGHNMGSVGAAKPPYRIKLNVEGLDGLARVELLRNNEVIRVGPVVYRPTSVPAGTGRYKFRTLFGWGRRRRKHEGIKEREWDVRMDLEQGELVGMEKLWMRFGQKIENTSSHGCHLHLTSGVSGTGQPDQAPFPGMVFEIKGTPETRVHLTINGLKHTFTLRESRAYPTVIGDIEECEQFIEDRYGVTRADLIDSQHDINEIWHEAYKTHILPAVHEGEFAGAFEWEDIPEHNAESWYYARVIQNNGQVAWSSPVWVTPEE